MFKRSVRRSRILPLTQTGRSGKAGDGGALMRNNEGEQEGQSGLFT